MTSIAAEISAFTVGLPSRGADDDPGYLRAQLFLHKGDASCPDPPPESTVLSWSGCSGSFLVPPWESCSL